MTTGIIGTGHTEFGGLDQDIYQLITEAGNSALAEAPIGAEDIGGIWIGNFSGGNFNNQEHLGAFAPHIDSELRFTPSTRVENACASGSAAIAAAQRALKAGEVEFALVIGAEKMTTLDTEGVTKTLAMASYWPDEGQKGVTFPGLFAKFAQGYQQKYDVTDSQLRDTLAQIGAKNHTNATENPLAQMPWDCKKEDILDKPDDKNPVIAPPLRLYDCSLVTDGAAALVLTTTDKAKELTDKVVEISSLAHTTDYLKLDKRANFEFTAGKKAVEKAYKQAGITSKDLDFAEVHDCFTIAELLAYETLGITDDGQGQKALEEGIVYPEGKTPVNVSGGLKAKGHPVGATGVSMAVASTRQLLNENTLGPKLTSPEVGLTFNIGGSAASNYVLTYKRIK